jgi:hypothetical protein
MHGEDSMARSRGHWKEFADATGIDAVYAQHQAEADRELEETLVSPKGDGLVPAGDAEMKNPNGEFQHPSPMQGAATGRGTTKPSEPEGQQGGTVRQWESWVKPVA